MASSKDVVIMGTNSYSIVSKRSVEYLNFAKDPQYLAEFVPQLKRRSPLINRGYWIRMKAIEDAVKNFIGRSPLLTQSAFDDGVPGPTGSSSGTVRIPKIIINFGCGEDTLPFRVLEQLGRSNSSSSEIGLILFIDVDYPDLMEAKAERIVSSELLCNALRIADARAARSHPLISLRATQYAALGADLNNLDSVTRQMQAVIDEYFSCSLHDLRAEVIFIAEVSITYMPTTASDALLSWSATAMTNAKKTFALLEQILPAGQDHPFAKTMLSHFEKSAPLQSVTRYPTLTDQYRRFTKAGWTAVAPRSLWDVWEETSDLFRQQLEAVEPFDEWEEFALFCSHYVFLIARDHDCSVDVTRSQNPERGGSGAVELAAEVTVGTMVVTSIPVQSKPRRFGAGVLLSSRHPGQFNVSHIGGYDADNRLSTDAEAVNRVLFPQLGSQSSLPAVAELNELQARETLFRGHPLPFVLRKQYLGQCTSKWDATSLSAATGPQRQVTIHAGETQSLNFTTKNFAYLSTSFEDLIRRAVAGEHVYLRALADGNSASTTPASLQRDFPSIAADFSLPEELQKSIAFEAVHSSVLRIAGRINMWLHYDVMANVFCQVRGRKRIVLFAPEDVLQLSFTHGSTTSGLQVFGPSGVLAESSEVSSETSNENVAFDKPDRLLDLYFPRLPTALACFTVTPLGTQPPSYVLIGGRASPRRASSACWMLRDTGGSGHHPSNWEPVAELEPGRFRHNAARVQVGGQSGVLVFGGKTSAGEVLGSWHIYASSIADAWITPVMQSDEAPEARFGATICTLSVTEGKSTGWVMGGMDRHHRLIDDLWEWTLWSNPESSNALQIRFKRLSIDVNSRTRSMLARFGATLTSCENGGAFLAGGTGLQGVLMPDQEVIHIRTDLTLSPVKVSAWEGNRPLLVGHSAIHHDGTTVIVGGGAVCFSFGSYWNQSMTVFRRSPQMSNSHLRLQAAGSAIKPPQEVVLSPGDCLYIPACWPHATAPAPGPTEIDSEDGYMSVAVNVFFRSLDKGYAAGRDVYGNRDLECYQNGRRDIKKIAELLEGCDGATKMESAQFLASLVRGEVSSDGPNVAVAGSREASRIRRSVQALPELLQRFYSDRLAAEIEDIAV